MKAGSHFGSASHVRPYSSYMYTDFARALSALSTKYATGSTAAAQSPQWEFVCMSLVNERSDGVRSTIGSEFMFRM